MAEPTWFDRLVDSGTADKLLTAGIGLGIDQFGLNDPKIQQVGYQGGIPTYNFTQDRVPNMYDPDRRPGSSGRRYFTDAQYTPQVNTTPDTASGLAAINAENTALANAMPVSGGIASVAPVAAPTTAPVAAPPPMFTDALDTDYSVFPEKVSDFYNLGYAGEPIAKTSDGKNLWSQDYPGATRLAVMPREGMRRMYDAEGGIHEIPISELPPVETTYGELAYPQVPGGSLSNLQQAAASGTVPMGLFAKGGIASLNKGRYLNGPSDGMADEIPARIDGKQEARLSGGEFVLPADTVSHLGNGNSDAGAKTLYAMMDRIRKARTGNDKQGKQIDPNKFLPV